MSFKNIFFFAVLALSLTSCSEEFQRKLEVTPNALGSANGIMVIADQDLWDSEVGDTFRFYFGAAYPMLPSPEPIFDIRHYTPEDMRESRLRKELRTYVYLANLSNNGSETAKIVAADIGDEKYMKIRQEGSTSNVVGRDKWALGQVIVYLAGRDKEDLYNNIKKSFPSVSKRIYEHDYKQIRGFTYASGYNKGLNAEILEKIGVNATIPADFIKAKWDEDQNLLWIRKETASVSFSKIFRKVDYTSQSQFSKAYVKELIEDFGRTHLTTNTPGSYLVVNDEDLPIYTNTIEINGQYAYEVRGIWETTKDYMGGPFFAYLIMDKSQQKLIFVLDFLFAPGKEKRDLMQQLELITTSMEVM